MADQKIRFTLKKQPGGGPSKVHAEVEGCSGPVCLDKVRPFLEALGTKDPAIEQKAEFSEAGVDVSLG